MRNTEKRNPNTTHIDQMPLLEALHVINQENLAVIDAVEKALPQIEAVCKSTVKAVANGGRIFYIGAGTSGRLGVMDAAECPPTYGVSADLFTGIIAGGKECMFRAAENQEDIAESGKADLITAGMKAGDVVIGISASGGAAYVVGALEYANENGAISVSIANNADTAMEKAAALSIVLDTGAEPITGSTRMKAGTAQKIVLNMISTMTLVKKGCVYENLMVNLRPTNIKLRARMISILCDIAQIDADEAENRLEKADWSIPAAMELFGTK